MNSGSTSYSPDYKSDRHPQYVCPECYGNHAQSEHSDVAAQRARLERAVIDKAKEFTSNDEVRDHWNALVCCRELCGAVDALLAFEPEQEAK